MLLKQCIIHTWLIALASSTIFQKGKARQLIQICKMLELETQKFLQQFGYEPAQCLLNLAERKHKCLEIGSARVHFIVQAIISKRNQAHRQIRWLTFFPIYWCHMSFIPLFLHCRQKKDGFGSNLWHLLNTHEISEHIALELAINFH